MSSLEEIQRANRELAEKINKEARNDPVSPYAGKFVGIANGRSLWLLTTQSRCIIA